MSYSYVKTVFPNFKYSNVYDTKLYDNLNISQHDNRLFEPANNSSQNYSDISLLKPNVDSKVESKVETFQDNQKFFNQPLPINNIPVNNNTIYRESFNENKNSGYHAEHTKHVLECSSCKELLMKQFGLENDRIRNEEIMELISYLIFGLFIVLLIDTYAKK
jgi:hypothetical protein